MTTPVDEKDQDKVHFPGFHHDSDGSATNVNTSGLPHEKSSEDEGTVVGDTTYQRRSKSPRHRSHSHLTVQIADHHSVSENRHLQSPSQVREQAHRLDDDLQMLQVEQQVSKEASTALGNNLSHTKSMHRSRSRRPEPVDEFDVATNPIHEQTQVYKPPEQPTTNFAKMIIRIHHSSFLVRYIIYITPLVLILLIPLLLGNQLFTEANVGGVYLDWFFIWLEIVWLSLWAGRILARLLPWPIGAVASVFTNNAKKWRDMGKQLELPATLFFWWLAIEVSFLPTMINHHTNGDDTVQPWENSMNKVLVSFFVGATLNFIAKVLIQLIAISFHLRTYADRIELNKFQINSLVKLYKFSKERIEEEDRDFEDKSAIPSGARTPGRLVREAQQNTIVALNRFGDVAGRIAGDFTGREVAQTSKHPHQVVLTLLATTSGSQVLARRLYRTFVREESGTVYSEDLRNAFDNEEEANAAFTMFDKDMNGDISMDELEAVCVEIGRERKSITASLKDLDSVVGKLDDVFMFIVVVIFILVLLSLISASTAGVLTSAGSTILALSWLFSATAQEFLQSIIFVFVKHPFDVGDRVTIYGNTGSLGRSDDYFVKEISLLYTEFKKMEGHVVQAPNSYLNTLFILNQRRSGGLAEAVPIVIKFGTTLAQIEGLRDRLLEFVKAEKREYQSNILTELREVTEAHSLTLNVIFFYKSNWQNEGLRLARRNKFICALMMTMQDLGIEGPRMRYPGQKESFPLYMQNIPHMATPGMGHGGSPDNPNGLRDEPMISEALDDQDYHPMSPIHETSDTARTSSIERTPSAPVSRRRRGESIAAMGQRVDLSLGASSISAANMAGDVYADRDPPPYRLPISVTAPTPSPAPDRTASKRRSSQSQSQSQAAFANPSIGPQRSDSNANRFNPLTRITTDSSMARTRSNHRNRFFGRMGRASLERERAAAAGLDGVDEQDMMELGMADIPEQNTPPRLSGANTPAPLDPRSGFVGSAAWRSSHDESLPRFQRVNPEVQPRASVDGGRNFSGSSENGIASPRRVRTDLR